MTILEFLALYVRQMTERCAKEYPAMTNLVQARYFEDENGHATVQIYNVGHEGIDITVPHRLTDRLREHWVPEITDEMFSMYLRGVGANA